MKKLPPPPPIQRVEVDPYIGLSNDLVSERVEKGYTNAPVTSPVKSVKQIILSNIFTYFNMIFFIIAICLLAVRSYNHLMFLPIILANLAIGIIQELNSKRTLDKLSIVNAPQALVVRNGREIMVPSESVVLDDIVIFSAGNQICADGIVMYGEVQVNESLITGEADEIVKRPGDELLSGSFIIGGECRARLDKVGSESFVSQLTLNAKSSRKNKDKGMMGSLTRLVQVIGVMIIPLAVLMYIKETNYLGLPVPEAIEATASALLGLIPEGLYLLTSVALAVSVIRLAKNRTLVHDLKCIESLARIDVLCVDKTGTITENDMQVHEFVPLNSINPIEIETLLNDFVSNHRPDNATMQALKERFSRDSYRQASNVVVFSSATKYSAVTIDNTSFVIGAPEFVLQENFNAYRDIVEEQTRKGCRVVLFGAYRGFITGGALPEGIQPVALILLTNNIRKEAPKTFEYFNNQGVAIKVISGDNAFTAADAARRAGIKNADKFIDARTLETPKKILEVCEEYTVFGRVTPEQKRLLIKALKRKGHTVAMTGDGVNDVLALKEADCSVAMASGSDVACQVSNLVLLDSDFSAMPKVVAEGRRVINNIERTASLFLVKNMFSLLLALLSLFVSFSYPILPAQLSLVSTFTIGIPAFFLSLQPNTGMVKGKFLRNVLYRSIPAAVTNTFVVGGVLLFAYAFEIPSIQMSTVATLVVGVVGIIMLFRVCQPLNPLRIIIWASVTVIFILSAIVLGDVFTLSLSSLTLGCYLIFTVFAMLTYPIMNSVSIGLDKLKDGIEFAIGKLTDLLTNRKDDDIFK
jgi:ATPase, P-type (transporting), HAD superfamily, subfamily IC